MAKDRDINNAAPKLHHGWVAARTAFNKKWIRRFLSVRVDFVLRSTEEQKQIYWSTRNTDGTTKKNSLGVSMRHKTFLDGIQKKSKHQANGKGYSEAIDFFFVDKKTRGNPAIWAGPIVRIGYSIMGRLCEKHGLTWGGRWKMRDMGHVQV